MSTLTDQTRDSDPIDLLLAAYCAGGLDPALTALVSSHLLMSPRNRAFVASLEAMAGNEIEACDPLPLMDRDARLAAIFALSDDAPASPRKPAPADIVLPPPLRDYLGGRLEDLRWKSLLPGVREHLVESQGRGEAKLIWTKGGRRMPRHTHEGQEITLVVKGAFRDATGVYSAGDLVIADSRIDHQPVTEQGEDCICFAVTDAPLHLSGPFGRIVDWLFVR